jgi:hypothetical protein
VGIMRHTDNIVVVFRISCFVVDKKVKGGVGWLKKQLDQKVRSSEFEGGGDNNRRTRDTRSPAHTKFVVKIIQACIYVKK